MKEKSADFLCSIIKHKYTYLNCKFRFMKESADFPSIVALQEMDICYAPPVSLHIMRMRLFLVYLIFLVNPFVLITHQHPHTSNVTDQQALLGFMSATTTGLLPTNWNPKVSFCRWSGITCSVGKQRVVSLNVSSMGLEEYGLGGLVTPKEDVYSYGIVLLEMLTGKKPTHDMFVEGMNLQNWVNSNFPDQIEKVVDKNLLKRNSMNNTEKDEELNCLGQLIRMGLLCTKETPSERPNMTDIVNTLQKIRKTFLGTDGNPKFQSDIWTFVANKSTSSNHAGESSSTF